MSNAGLEVDDRRLAVSQQDTFKVAPVFPSGINIFMHLPSLAVLPTSSEIVFLDFCPDFHLACAATFFLREHTGHEQSTPCTSFTRLLFI
ncbi:hypothetical protein NDU88_006782 [Pleurodeles waltl]|uniref:Uncharacterized protein n=1 Tax=Pleurodeles waltl TaxID=8319 RepID=A0AAV7QK18_PLEWA|nr:hypothetical protein NDU88_006782 [Pleurodeles waltl]